MSDIVKDFDRFLTEWVNRAHEERRDEKDSPSSPHPYAYFRGKCDTLEIVRMKWKEYMLAERGAGVLDE